jgi:hypothetical protein
MSHCSVLIYGLNHGALCGSPASRSNILTTNRVDVTALAHAAAIEIYIYKFHLIHYTALWNLW